MHKIRSGKQLETNMSAQEPLPAVRAVFLVGFMGAGKTSVGRALSRQFSWAFEDLDDRIQAREKRSIAQIFSESGEAAFRCAEHAALREMLGELGASPKITALGGGAYVQPENAALLEQAGFHIVFLDAPVDELYARCQQEKAERPLRRDAGQFRELYHARRPYYLKAAWRIETSGKQVEAVAAEVARALGLE